MWLQMHGGPITLGDIETATPVRSRRLQVDRYVLDLDRGCLLLDSQEIALRPKTFSVLQYLTENSGRLVSKDDLFAAVWPKLVVTDDVLVQSIGELRRALGDDGPRIIRTVQRRGYRLEAAVRPNDRSEFQTSVAGTAVGEASAVNGAVGRSVLAPFGKGFAAWYTVVAGSTILAVLLVAGALWTSFFPEWASDNTSRPSERPAQKARPAIEATIAVLPFVNQNENPAREYFADGLTQDIISALGRFSELTVMSWNAVVPYKGKLASPKETGRSLAVRYQVEGRVRQTGDRVRVTAQLVDTNDARILWSARFDEAMADVFALQDTITNQIVGALAVRVRQIEQRRVSAKPTENLEAYDYVLRARPALQHPTRATNVEARGLLRRAIDLDPNYAAAYAALADTYHIATALGWAESASASLSRAEELAQKALSLDQSEVRARIILGRIHIFYQRYDQASAEIEHAIAINPNDAHGLAGRGNVLMWTGHTDAALEALEHARRIDPDLNAVDRFALSLAYYLKGRYREAIEQAELNLRVTAGADFSRIVLAAAYAQEGRAEDAKRIAAAIKRLDPAFEAPAFGSKFLNPDNLEHVREGLRKAGFFPDGVIQPGN